MLIHETGGTPCEKRAVPAGGGMTSPPGNGEIGSAGEVEGGFPGALGEALNKRKDVAFRS